MSHAQVSEPVRADLSRLDFEFSPAISARVRHELLESLAKASRCTLQDVEAALGARDLHAEFASNFAPAGLRLSNLADVNAAYWGALWSVIHDAPALAADTLQALRGQLGRMWLANPVARRQDDRQAMAELMVYETVLALDQQRQAREQGPAAVSALAAQAHLNMLKRRGVNLKAMKISPQGLSR